MSGTTISPTACYIDDAGIHAPAFADMLSYIQAQVQGIYGSDTYLGNDSMDGQLIGIFVSALYDTNSMAIAVYNSFSPSTARGVGLSSVVKINGISRLLPTNSTVDVRVAGVAGTQIFNGVVTDLNNNNWLLPPLVTIPNNGPITVTATAQLPGAITAPATTVTKISTPTLGWQTVTNPLDAVPGEPLETDPPLRARQTRSTMLPSVSALDGIIGAISDVSGVIRYQAYENDTDVTDANGIPGHTLSFVIEGGDSIALAQTIALKKTPGAGTYGTTQEVVIDQYGVPHTISFYRPTIVPIQIVIHLTPLTGYTSAIGTEIVNAVIAYVNSTPIGGPSVFWFKVGSIANLTPPDTLTFNITSVLMARSGGTPAEQDVPLAFNEAAQVDVTTVTLSIP